jgi:hypothetical protein
MIVFISVDIMHCIVYCFFMLEYDCLHNIHMCITLVFLFLQWFSEGTSIQSKHFSFHTPSFNSLGATQLLHIWDLGPLRDSPLVTISLIIPKKLNFLHFSPVNSTPFRSTPAARWSIASAPFGTFSFQLVDGVSMSTGLGSLLCQASSTWPGAIVPQLRFWLPRGKHV